MNKARIESDTHARMTWGPAQAGVAGGVAEAVAKEIVFDIDDVLIAAVWVNPAADDAETVFANNLEATVGALAMGQQGLPSATDIEEFRTELWNPFFRRPLLLSGGEVFGEEGLGDQAGEAVGATVDIPAAEAKAVDVTEDVRPPGGVGLELDGLLARLCESKPKRST